MHSLGQTIAEEERPTQRLSKTAETFLNSAKNNPNSAQPQTLSHFKS